MSEPTSAGDLLPKLTAYEGRTVYVCRTGHRHEFLSLAVACDLWLAPEADEWPDGSIGRKPQ